MNTAQRDQWQTNLADAHLLADLESGQVRLAPGMVLAVPVGGLLELQVEARRAHYGGLLLVGPSRLTFNAGTREARAQAMVDAMRALGCEVPVLRYELDRHILDEALGRTQS